MLKTEELKILNLIADAHNEFVKLERIHPSEIQEWGITCTRTAANNQYAYCNKRLSKGIDVFEAASTSMNSDYSINKYDVTINRTSIWPFEEKWLKPTPDDRVRELAKAGALIAAEIDRLQRCWTRDGVLLEKDEK